VIGIPTALLLGVVLVLFLILLAIRGNVAERESSLGSGVPRLDDENSLDLCPPQFVARIFSSEDWEFVAATQSPQLEKLLSSERKLVALAWVQQTSSAIRGIMREHTRAARQSHDLHFATEAKLVLLYARLMLLCGILFLAIQSAGPQRVRGLAVYADALSQRLAQAQQNLNIVTAGRELHGANPS
jgi:hypothetical protein